MWFFMFFPGSPGFMFWPQEMNPFKSGSLHHAVGGPCFCRNTTARYLRRPGGVNGRLKILEFTTRFFEHIEGSHPFHGSVLRVMCVKQHSCSSMFLMDRLDLRKNVANGAIFPTQNAQETWWPLKIESFMRCEFILIHAHRKRWITPPVHLLELDLSFQSPQEFRRVWHSNSKKWCIV